MPDYKNMSAKEALREAKDASGMTAEEIARGLGISASHMRRYLDAGDSLPPPRKKRPSVNAAERSSIPLTARTRVFAPASVPAQRKAA
ncbi:MAG: hypothetical protein MEBIL_02269 [Bilophila sp.]